MIKLIKQLIQAARQILFVVCAPTSLDYLQLSAITSFVSQSKHKRSQKYKILPSSLKSGIKEKQHVMQLRYLDGWVEFLTDLMGREVGVSPCLPLIPHTMTLETYFEDEVQYLFTRLFDHSIMLYSESEFNGKCDIWLCTPLFCCITRCGVQGAALKAYLVL